ncbi:FecR protein [Planctomycetes bacterium MalM25]|nr:FecR protein [Planctomycetes bacterium MalM25]
MSGSLDQQEHALFEAACTDRLDASSYTQLQELLRSSPESRRHYLDYASLHSDLFGTLAAARVRARLEEMIEDPPIPAAVNGTQPAVATRWLLGVFAVAATLLMALTLTGTPTGPDQNPDELPVAIDLQETSWPGLVATITRVDGADWQADARRYEPADLVAAGEAIAIASGLVEIEFRQGAVVVLEGPAHLIAEEANGATLLKGKLAAVAPPWATGFRIDTPGVDVIDHGTEFAVSVSDEGGDPKVNVVVTEGEVEVLKEGQADGGRRLKAGEGVRSSGATVEAGDDAAARQLTEQLPDREELNNAVVIADRWHDWEPGIEGHPSREGPWRYYTNAVSPFGDPSGYAELVWDAPSESYRPVDREKKPAFRRYVRVHREGGHPGLGSTQSGRKLDHYSISAFTVPEDGVYRIEAGWLERKWPHRWDEDQVLDVAVNVNDGPRLLHKICDRSSYLTFRGPLGELKAGDTIYAGVGPNGVDYGDRFRWGFYVVREKDPPAAAADLAAHP